MSRPPHLRLVGDRDADPGPGQARPTGAPEPRAAQGFSAAPAPETDLRAEIVALEEAIEVLAARARTCAKLARLALGLAGGGVALLALLLLGVLGQAPGALILGLSGLLGGLALAGTNASTRDEVEAALKEREAERDDLVGWLDLRLVPARRED